MDLCDKSAQKVASISARPRDENLSTATSREQRQLELLGYSIFYLFFDLLIILLISHLFIYYYF